MTNKHSWVPPEANDGLEGHLFAHNAVRSSRQFLQDNPEGGKKTLPKITEWSASIDHVYNYPGDMKLYQGSPAPKGRRAK
jgi:hypothetical protein